MSSVAPLSYVTIEAWIRLMDIQFTEPYHIEALLLLDSVLLAGDAEEEKETPVAEEKVFRAWPEAKK